MNQLDIWYKRNIQGNPHICSVDFGYATFIAVGQGIFTSPDGITWTMRESPLNYPYEISDVAARGGRFVAVTYDNVNHGDMFPMISLLSDDKGVSWKHGLEVATTLIPQAITSYGSVFIVAGYPDMDSGIQISTDLGSTWKAVPFPQNSLLHYFNDICVGQDVGGKHCFVGVGQVYNGGPGNYTGCFYSAASSDGITWTEHFSGGLGEFRSVAYGNGVFVAIGSNRRFYTSIDGLYWTGRTYQPADDLFKITFGQNTFLAVGANGNVYDSPDGDHWNVRNIGTTTALREVHFCGNTFVVVDENGTIFQSERYDRPLLGVIFEGYGSVGVQPTGVRVLSNWGTTYPKGTVVTLDARGEQFINWVTDPNGNKIPIKLPFWTFFDGWSGLPLNPKSPIIPYKTNPITVTMNADNSITAHFSIFPLKRPFKISREEYEKLSREV